MTSLEALSTNEEIDNYINDKTKIKGFGVKFKRLDTECNESTYGAEIFAFTKNQAATILSKMSKELDFIYDLELGGITVGQISAKEFSKDYSDRFWEEEKDIYEGKVRYYFTIYSFEHLKAARKENIPVEFHEYLKIDLEDILKYFEKREEYLLCQKTIDIIKL